MTENMVCGECDEPVCEHVIEQVRKMENALIVAKQAITTLESLEKKRLKEIADMRKQMRNLKEAVNKKKTQNAMDQKIAIEKKLNGEKLFRGAIAGGH